MKLPRPEIDKDTAMQLWMTDHSDYAKEQVILANTGLIGIVLKSLNLSAQDEDLFSIGIIGLLKALNSFDIEKGYKFSTYASRAISNEVLMTFRKKRVDIAFSLDEVIEFEENCSTYAEIIPDKTIVEEDVLAKVQYEKLLNTVSERERVILILTLDGKTQRDISNITGLSQPQVSRIIRGVRKRYGS